MSILVPVTHTTPQIEGVTRNEIFKRFLRETGLGDYGTITATGSTATLTDTVQLKSAQFTTRDHVGGWARIGSDAGGSQAAPEDEQSPVTTYVPSTGIVTFSPVMTVAPTTNDQYQLWHGINPQLAKDFLDDLLTEEIYLPYWSVLSEVPDYDMEQSSASSDWTASNATVTKQTGEPRMGGTQKLRVVATSANGYVAANTFNVEPRKTYHVSALGQVQDTATTATLQAYDVTNSAAIKAVSITNLYAGRVHFDFTTPSTCQQVSIRLITVTNGKYAEWNDVVLYSIDANEIALPWWVKQRSQIKAVFQLREDEVISDMWDSTLVGERTHEWMVQDSAFGRGQLKLVSHTNISRPLFIFGIRNETAFVDDTSDTKYVDSQLLQAGLANKVFTWLAQNPNTGAFTSDWIEARRKDWAAKWKELRRSHTERIEEIDQSIQSEALYGKMPGRFG